MEKSKFIEGLLANENQNALKGLAYLYKVKIRRDELKALITDEEKEQGMFETESWYYDKEIKKYSKLINLLLDDKDIVEELNKQQKDNPDLRYIDVYKKDGEFLIKNQDKIKMLKATGSANEEELTGRVIGELANINKKLEAMQTVSINDDKYNSAVDGLIDSLCKIYSSYYDEKPPKAIFYGSKIYTTQQINTTVSRWKILEMKGMGKYEDFIRDIAKIGEQYNCYKNVLDIIDFENILDKIEKKRRDNANADVKEMFSFPVFHLGVALGVKGIYAPLTEWLEKNGKERIKNMTELKNFLIYHIQELSNELVAILTIKNNDTKPEKETVEAILYNLCNVIFLDEYYAKIMLKIKFCHANAIKYFHIKETNEQLLKLDNAEKNFFYERGKAENTTFIPIKYAGESDGLYKMVYYSTSDKWEAYQKLPMWAYRISDALRNSGGTDWGKIPLGKNKKTEKQTKLSLKGPFSWFLSLMAGSGSGKGVTTMAIVGQAIAKRFPIIYLDCKPEMAITISEWGGIGIDGLNNDGLNGTNTHFQEMVDKMKKKIENASDDNIKQLCNGIIWTRVVEMFIHLAYIRAKFNEDKSSIFNPRNTNYIGKEDTELKDLLEEIGKDTINPLLVMDEFQAESIQIDLLLDLKAGNKSVTYERDGQTQKITPKIKAQAHLIGNLCNDNVGQIEYLNRISDWIQGVFGTGEGLLGNIMTAFGRQSKCNFFTISQNVPEKDENNDNNYGVLLGNVLRGYIPKYVKLYGKGTHDAYGSYGYLKQLSKTSDSYDPTTLRKELNRGEFVKVGDGKIELCTTYLCLDDAIVNGKPGKSLLNAVEGSEEAKAEIFNPDGSIKEDRVKTDNYIADIMRKEGQPRDNGIVKKNLQYSLTYFDKFCDFLYGCSFWDRMTNVESFNLKNPNDIFKSKGSEINENDEATIKKVAEYIYIRQLENGTLQLDDYDNMMKEQKQEEEIKNSVKGE